MAHHYFCQLWPLYFVNRQWDPGSPGSVSCRSIAGCRSIAQFMMLTCFLLEDIASICWRLWRHVRRSIPLFHVLPPYGGFEFFQCQNLIWGLGHLCLAMKSPLAVNLQHLTTYNILQLGIALLPLASYYFLFLPHILPASSTLWRLRFWVGGRFGFQDALSVL